MPVGVGQALQMFRRELDGDFFWHLQSAMGQICHNGQVFLPSRRPKNSEQICWQDIFPVESFWVKSSVEPVSGLITGLTAGLVAGVGQQQIFYAIGVTLGVTQIFNDRLTAIVSV